MATKKQAAKRLLDEHTKNGKTWRELAADYRIPAGTLARIANSGGEFWPRKWAMHLWLKFGVQDSPKAKKSASRPRRLFDMSVSALRQAFENRKVMA